MKTSRKVTKKSAFRSIFLVIPWLIIIVAFVILGVRLMDPTSTTILMFSFTALYFVTVFLIEEDKMNDKAIAVVFSFVVVIGLGLWQINNINKETNARMSQIEDKLSQETISSSKSKDNAIQYLGYKCQKGKHMFGLFSDNGVTVTLSDSRVFNLQRTVSADGMRFASEDDKKVFWVKGDVARFDEGDKTTFEDCNLTK